MKREIELTDCSQRSVLKLLNTVSLTFDQNKEDDEFPAPKNKSKYSQSFPDTAMKCWPFGDP
jgi:hypothetical protein